MRRLACRRCGQPLPRARLTWTWSFWRPTSFSRTATPCRRASSSSCPTTTLRPRRRWRCCAARSTPCGRPARTLPSLPPPPRTFQTPSTSFRCWSTARGPPSLLPWASAASSPGCWRPSTAATSRLRRSRGGPPHQGSRRWRTCAACTARLCRTAPQRSSGSWATRCRTAAARCCTTARWRRLASTGCTCPCWWTTWPHS
mmetsp:Transcript_27421/g.70486  ORF Transcript_27421/g.70486 Transcript_27421/m.70486 type:complete len:200 (+) Transcript_27421:267-866(+)